MAKKKEIEKKELAPTESNSVIEKNAEKTYTEDMKRFIRRLQKEPRVKVYGNEVFQSHMGKSWTFTFNNVDVTLKFDGTYQEFPQSIAKRIEKKLERTSRAIASKNINVQI